MEIEALVYFSISTLFIIICFIFIILVYKNDYFKSQLTLGQRRKEIISIFTQFDNRFSKYLNEKEEDFELRIDEALLVRHAVVHQNTVCTYIDIEKHCTNLKRFVEYTDEIMNRILKKYIQKEDK